MVLFGGWAKTQAGGRALRFVLMAIGFLYDVSIRAAVVFCVARGAAALPFFFAVRRQVTA
ncbi:MAG: hypothetical protein WA891_11160 [Acidobacteriaceae bacterium]